MLYCCKWGQKKEVTSTISRKLQKFASDWSKNLMGELL